MHSFGLIDDKSTLVETTFHNITPSCALTGLCHHWKLLTMVAYILYGTKPSASTQTLCWLYSENARVCGKWQWNAQDCVTGLHDRRSRECNPVTPVECVSLLFRTHPMRSRFYHTHIMYKGNWYNFCLVNSIYFALHIFLICPRVIHPRAIHIHDPHPLETMGRVW